MDTRELENKIEENKSGAGCLVMIVIIFVGILEFLNMKIIDKIDARLYKLEHTQEITDGK